MLSLTALRPWLLCAAAAASPALARADTAVVTPPSHDEGTNPERVRAAERALGAFFTREAPGTSVVLSSALTVQVSPALRACLVPSCAGELASAAHADFTVLLHVFAGDGSAAEGSVSAAFVGPDGVVYAGAASFGGEAELHDAESATQRALTIARERRQRGPGPWLRVRAPEGSRVSVDGGAAVAPPYLERHEPGLHRIEVTGPAGTSILQTLVTLPDDPASYEEVTAAPAETRAPVPPDRGHGYFLRPRSPWNYYVGVPLAALGVAGMVTGLVHHARRGDCVDDCQQDAQGDYRVYGVSGLSRALLFGGAGLTAVGGLGFLAVGLIRSPHDAPQGMMLQLHGRF
jgi:hypothetical protein